MYDYTVPDCIAYLNPRFRPRILETITHQMNMIVTKLALEEPRFKGKISIVAHSLGTVISYDLLTRQKWENFGHSTAEDVALETIEKIRSGSNLYNRTAAHITLHLDDLAVNFARPSYGNKESFASHGPNHTNLIENDYLQLIFPIKNFLLFGSPLGMFGAVYFEEPFIRSKLPTVDEFYNVFHPSDLVANRLEPLIKRYEYPDHRHAGKGSFFSVARGVSHVELDNDEDYQFGDQILGPVLIPWYQNHGLCRS